jgi:hypothetical protein
MICSGLCLRRFIVVWSSLPHDGVSDSHNGWISSRGPGHEGLSFVLIVSTHSAECETLRSGPDYLFFRLLLRSQAAVV